MPVPSAPPPGAVLPRRGGGQRRAPEQQPQPAAPDIVPALAVEAKMAPRASEVNELLPFLTFVEHHPPGTSVSAIVDSYSSHGAYVTIGDVRGYVPLRLMSEPAPRSAREFMKVGESVTLVVESFAPARRSIDLALPAMATAKLPAPKPARRTKKAAPVPEPVVEDATETAEAAAPEAPAPTRARRTKKAAPVVADVVTVLTDPAALAAAAPPAPRQAGAQGCGRTRGARGGRDHDRRAARRCARRRAGAGTGEAGPEGIPSELAQRVDRRRAGGAGRANRARTAACHPGGCRAHAAQAAGSSAAQDCGEGGSRRRCRRSRRRRQRRTAARTAGEALPAHDAQLTPAPAAVQR